MENYFDKYTQAKKTLFFMVSKNYETSISKEEADKYHITYSNNDMNIEKKVNVYFHNYEPLGEKAWHLLKLDNSIISLSNFWKIDLNEQEDVKKNYQKEYLEICLLVLKIASEKYSYSIYKEAADKMHIVYDYNDLDRDSTIEIYDHFYEVAGLKTWQLLEIDKDKVPSKVFKDKEKNIKKKLLEIDKSGV